LKLMGDSSPPTLNPRYYEGFRQFKVYFVRSNGLINVDIEDLWENVQLRDSEDFVIKALLPLNENLISVRLIEYPPKSGSKVATARLKERVRKPVTNESSFEEISRLHKHFDYSEPVPLKSLGEGMTRLFGLALALVNCRNGMLLIDEIESGLHYSVLPDVWKLIFRTAKDLNVQVFATTHSKDCIEAFAQAAYDSPEEGMLIRLERQGENIVAKTIEEEMLVDAVNYEVEVR